MERRKRICTISVVCVMAILLLWYSISVFAMTDSSVLYHFFTGKVAVRLEEFTLKDGNYVLAEHESIVIPGDYVSRIPVIYNEGEDCYVRAKIDISSDKKGSVPITLDNIQGIGEHWIQVGEYFYYREILPAKGHVILFEGIQMPKDWNPLADSGNAWTVEVRAEAIQAEHRSLDLEGLDPWKLEHEGAAILAADETEALHGQEEKGSVIFEIEEDLEGFYVGIERTMQNLGIFMPGDRKERRIQIQNQTTEDRFVCMSADVSGETQLLEMMHIKIVWEMMGERDVLYDGKLCDLKDALRESRVVISGKCEGSVVCSLELPKEANNTYAAKEALVKIALSNELPKMEVSEIPEADVITQNSAVKTGDSNTIWIWLVCMILTLPVIAVCLWRRKGLEDDV